MADHTPAPWWADDDGLIREEATDATIARVYEDDGHIDPQARRSMPRAANARLIAAAPDLLEALQLLLAWAKDVHSPSAIARINYAGMDVASAAIAKATGEQA